MRLIRITNVKHFMNKLLIESTFDSFLVSEVTVKAANSFVIDGHINEGFYTSSELDTMKDEARSEGRIFSEKLTRFSQIKPFVLSTIKGKKTPEYFKMSFYLASENIQKLLSSADTSIKETDIDGLSLIVKFQDDVLACTTSVSLNVFSPDKSLDKIWDDMVLKFLDSQEIRYEVM